MKRATSEMFLQATIHTVVEVGIENLRTKYVADCAGFSEAALFQAFESKDVLLRSTSIYVDKRLSDFLTRNIVLLETDGISFEEGLQQVWRNVYRHLIENREETIFLIRYRYSSMYTDEVHSQRKAYNSSFEKVYEVFEKRNRAIVHAYWEFLINYLFEITLCFAEKIISGKMEDTPEIENRNWIVVAGTMREFTKNLETKQTLGNAKNGRSQKKFATSELGLDLE